MAAVDREVNKFSSIAHLFGKIGSISEEQLLTLLKQLLGDNFAIHMFKLILEMTEDQRNILLEKLEGMTLDDGKIERRGHSRKPCLMSVDYTVNNRDYRSFILDISAFGIFIETKNLFPPGQEMKMRFTVPTHSTPFKLTGEIVWCGTQGIGVKFKYLTRFQLDIIKSFSEKMAEVYEIIS
ncbi:MAG: PilZ domain-containing protein [Desulfobacterales bacterium]|jgi:Tfp pilus assembly protein PilZ